MKRRCSRLNSNDPWQIPNSSQGSHRVSCSGFQAPTSTSLGNGIKEMTCQKRMRFEDLEVEDTLIKRRDASSVPVDLAQAPRSDEPKTSEYAFFKKLKENVGHNLRSHLLHSDVYQSNKLNSSSYPREMTAIVETSCKRMRPSLPVSNATPVNTDTFVSPFQYVPKNSDVNMKNACANLKTAHRKQKDVEKHNHALGSEGTQSWHSNIFNRKRQKLRQWVADTSLPEIDELCSKGCNIVSILLSRLIPESKKRKNDKDGNFGHVETDSKSALLASAGSDIHSVKFDWMLEREPCFRNAISSSQKNTSVARIPLLDCPLGLAKRTDIHCKEWKSDRESLGGALSLYTESDLSIISPVRNYRHFACLDELDFFCGEGPNKSKLALYIDHTRDGRYSLPQTNYQGIEQKTYFSSSDSWMDDDNSCPEELLCSSDLHNDREPRSPLPLPHMPMLAWDFDNKKDEKKLWRTTLVSPVVVNKSSSCGLFSSPNCPNNKELENLLPLSCLSSHHYHEESENSLLLLDKACYHNEFGENVLKDKDDIIPYSSHIPLTLSCLPNYLNQSEDCHNDTVSGSNISFFPNRDHLLMEKEYNHTHKEDLYYSGLVLDVGLKCLPIWDYPKEYQQFSFHDLQFPGRLDIASHLANDECQGYVSNSSHGEALNKVSIHDKSSFCFQMSLDSEKVWPMTLNKTSYDECSETEKYSNSDDSQCNIIDVHKQRSFVETFDFSC